MNWKFWEKSGKETVLVRNLEALTDKIAEQLNEKHDENGEETRLGTYPDLLARVERMELRQDQQHEEVKAMLARANTRNARAKRVMDKREEELDDPDYTPEPPVQEVLDRTHKVDEGTTLAGVQALIRKSGMNPL